MGPEDLVIRPVRPQDRDRVLELTADVWDGGDYLPRVFDQWVADPAGNFQAGELGGTLVALQRLRPIAPGIVFYEGMRVASTHRRLGLGRAMLREALAEARRSGAREVRLVTGNPHAMRLFQAEGFARRAEFTAWTAGRVEGGDPARVPSPADVPRLLAQVRADPAFAAQGGVDSYWSAPVDIDEDLLRRRAEQGHLRVNGRALAGLSPTRTDRVGVNFVFGSGAQLQDLLMALRFEADADGLEGVWLAAPPGHPAVSDFAAVGYDLAPDAPHFFVYALGL